MFSRIRAALAWRKHARVAEADNTRPYLVECPYCDVATMSQAAMNEHLRTRHGDS